MQTFSHSLSLFLTVLVASCWALAPGARAEAAAGEARLPVAVAAAVGSTCQQPPCPPTPCNAVGSVLVIPDGKQSCKNMPDRRANHLCTKNPLIPLAACRNAAPLADAQCQNPDCACRQIDCTYQGFTKQQVDRSCWLTCSYGLTGVCDAPESGGGT